MFQSTHPHGVRQAAGLGVTRVWGVSIHAPARGATHAFPILLFTLNCFNPRTRTGCDYFTWEKKVFPFLVSIHAPARGATLTKITRNYCQVFQSTHPHGVRPAGGGNGVRVCDVSIHAPARGATLLNSAEPSWNAVSIHAPARGATMHFQFYCLL